MGPGGRPCVGMHSSAQRPFSTVRPRVAAEDLRSSSSMVRNRTSLLSPAREKRNRDCKLPVFPSGVGIVPAGGEGPGAAEPSQLSSECQHFWQKGL